MLMVLENFNIIKANKYYENYYNKFRSKYLNEVPLSKVSWFLVKNNLSVEIFHLDKEYFFYKGYLDEYCFNNCKKEYLEYISFCRDKGAVVSCGIDINSNYKNIN